MRIYILLAGIAEVWGGHVAVLAEDWLIFVIGVLAWEAILATITYWLLRRKIQRAETEVRSEAARIAAETEAKYTPLFADWENRLKGHEEAIKRLADWIAEEEKAAIEDEEIRRRELAERGALGAQTARDRGELSRLAYEEGSAIIRGPGSQEEKQNKLLGLLRAYPDVALGVARRLNRAFRISEAFGISEADLLKIVAQQAAQGLQALSQPPAAPEGY